MTSLAPARALEIPSPSPHGLAGRAASLGGERSPSPFPALSFSSFPALSFLLGLAAVALYYLPGAAAWLEYDRAAIAQGQLWRLLTAHWTHFSPSHLYWDAAAFVALGAACERQSRGLLLTTVLASAAAVSLVVWIALPGMQTYRGLSGLDSALFASLAVQILRNNASRTLRLATSAGFLILLVKIVYEVATQDCLFAESSAAFVPVPVAHLAGACVGALVSLARTRPLLRSKTSL